MMTRSICSIKMLVVKVVIPSLRRVLANIGTTATIVMPIIVMMLVAIICLSLSSAVISIFGSNIIICFVAVVIIIVMFVIIAVSVLTTGTSQQHQKQQDLSDSISNGSAKHMQLISTARHQLKLSDHHLCHSWVTFYIFMVIRNKNKHVIFLILSQQ